MDAWYHSATTPGRNSTGKATLLPHEIFCTAKQRSRSQPGSDRLASELVYRSTTPLFKTNKFDLSMLVRSAALCGAGAGAKEPLCVCVCFFMALRVVCGASLVREVGFAFLVSFASLVLVCRMIKRICVYSFFPRRFLCLTHHLRADMCK